MTMQSYSATISEQRSKDATRMNPLPTQSQIREWVSYDAETGIFRWIKEPTRTLRGRKFLGKVAGSFSHRYVHIRFRDMGRFRAHRLAWVFVHGSVPEGMEIDHRDGDPSNNRLSNLRLATSSQQKMNKTVQRNSSSGLKGACFHKCGKRLKRWSARIKVDGKQRVLGYFFTAEEAHAAYAAAAITYFGEFARAA